MNELCKRITSLVCVACESGGCDKCNVDDMAQRIVSDIRNDTIDEFLSKMMRCVALKYVDIHDIQDIARMMKGAEQ